MVSLRSDHTLYLSGGAFLRSYIKAENTAIKGRGVIDGTGVNCKVANGAMMAMPVLFRPGENILIDGVVIYDSPLKYCYFWHQRNCYPELHVYYLEGK